MRRNEPQAFRLDGINLSGGTQGFFILFTQPEHGTLSGTPPDLLYTPHPEFTGQDYFEFKFRDGDVESGPALVSLVISGGLGGGTPGPSITSVTISGSQLILRGHSGTSGRAYEILASTQVTLPRAQWLPVTTGTFGQDGSFSNAVPIDPGFPQRFFRLHEPDFVAPP